MSTAGQGEVAGSRVENNRPRGNKTERMSAEEDQRRIVKGGGVGTGNAIGGAATDSLAVEVGLGANAESIFIKGIEYQLSPFTFLHLEEAAKAIADVPLVILATGIDRRGGKEPDAERITQIMGFLRPETEFTTDSARMGLPMTMYSLEAHHIASITKLLRFSLFGFHEDQIESGELDDTALMKYLTLERAIDFMAKLFNVNLGIYDRFLKGFEGSPPPVGVFPALVEREEPATDSGTDADDSEGTQN